MKKLWGYARTHGRLLIYIVIGVIALAGLLLYKLAFLTGGLSAGELAVSRAPLGWHGIYHDPFYLPLKLARSLVFMLFPDHGQLLTRLPSALFGGLTVLTFAWLARLWHGTRPAILATILFATSAWTLHISRLASDDIMYLWGGLTLLLVNARLHKRGTEATIWYGSLLTWGLLTYIPGLIWLILISVYLESSQIKAGWLAYGKWWQRSLYALAGLIWLPLLIKQLLRTGQLTTWLGLPHHLASPIHLMKQVVAVPIHLFGRGPQYPTVWLDRLPLLDAFTLVICVIGFYFYASRIKQVSRGRLLGIFLLIGSILVGLGGPVSLSLVVPLLYIAAGTGIAYLLHDWLRVFPNNPLARGLGVGLIILAVSVSSLYNLRSYFVAWPHNHVTHSSFQYHP
jgi:hypothetical protein